MSSVTLADGSQYRFRYNSYGELARIDLPGNGAYEFTWGKTGGDSTGADVTNLAILRGVIEIREYPDGQSLGRREAINYSIPNVPSGGVQTSTSSASEYDGSGNLARITKHYFYKYIAPNHDPLSHNAWKDGLEYRTEIYAADGTLMKAMSNTWQQRGPLPWPDQGNPYLGTADTQQAFDPAISRTDTTLDNGMVSSTVLGHDQYSNVTDRYEYDFGQGAPGALVSHTWTSYVPNGNYSTLPVWLVRLPTQQNVYAGASTLTALTFYHYDDYNSRPLADEPGITGHDASMATAYTFRGNLMEKDTWINTSNAYATETYTYDIAGNLITYNDPLSQSTSYSYADPLNTYAHATTTTNTLNQSTHAQYDFSTGKVILATDLNGVNTTYAYNDPLDRLTEIHRAAGGGPNLEGQTYITYETPVWTVRYDSQVQGWSLRTDTLYDGFGRLAETRNFEDETNYISRRQSYDSLGRIASTTNPSRPGDGLDFPTAYSYDALDRPTGTKTADGSSSSTAYSGNQVTATDQAGKQREFTYDALGRLASVWEGPSDSHYVTNYGYDVLNNLTSVTQGPCPTCLVRSFTYDSLSRLTKAVNPESGAVLYDYDTAGNLKHRTDNRGFVTSYSYDGLNRLRIKTYSDPNTPTAGYVFDSPNVSYGTGRLASVCDGYACQNILGYDALGRVLASNQQINSQTYPFSYSYNLAGTLTSEKYPSGRTITFARDTADRILQVAGTLNASVKSYYGDINYAPHGAPNWYLYGNNLCQSFSYNSRLQPTWMGNSVLQGAIPNGNCANGSNQLLVQTMNWGSTNNNGNLQSVTAYHGGPGYPQLVVFSTSYSYDAVNRLTFAVDSNNACSPAANYACWFRSFGYDAWGNMWVTSNGGLPEVTATPTANVFNGSNQMAGASYDAAGNQTVLGADTYLYDAENRLIKVTETPAGGGGQEQLFYDGNGRRVEKLVTNGPAQVYVYDAFGQLAAEYSTAMPSNTLPCTTCYLSADHLGSTRLVTGESGNVISRHDYIPFGEEISGNTAGRGAEWGPLGDNVNQKFTGKERDLETGLDYFGARYYGSSLGRFTSPDPFTVTAARVADPQQLNLYAYGRNNPLKYVDPTGMIIDDSACQADKNCAKKWQQVQNIANQQDKNGNYLHPELHNVLGTLQSDSRTFALENSKLSPGTAGLFTITNFTSDGKDFTRATLQLDFKQIQGVSNVTGADLVPGFNKYEGLLGSPIDRLAETFGHEGGHGLFSIENPAQAVGIQQILNDRDAAMQHARYPYPPDIMQKIDAANKALIPTEKFAQQVEKIINGELQADKKKQ